MRNSVNVVVGLIVTCFWVFVISMLLLRQQNIASHSNLHFNTASTHDIKINSNLKMSESELGSIFETHALQSHVEHSTFCEGMRTYFDLTIDGIKKGIHFANIDYFGQNLYNNYNKRQIEIINRKQQEEALETVWWLYKKYKNKIKNVKKDDILNNKKKHGKNDAILQSIDIKLNLDPKHVKPKHIYRQKHTQAAYSTDSATYDDVEELKSVTAAFVYLTEDKARNKKNEKNLALSLYKLFMNFNEKYRYKVLIYHEPSFNVKSMSQSILALWRSEGTFFQNEAQLQASFKLIFFIQIEFHMPQGLTLESWKNFRASTRAPKRIKNMPVGYSHMCRFFFAGVFSQPEVKRLDYYARLDTDSFIESPITFDIFKMMRFYDYKYAYILEREEQTGLAEGFTPFIEKFIREHMGTKIEKLAHINGLCDDSQEHVGQGCTSTIQNPRLYYNNFEVASVSTFSPNGSLMKPFIDAVDKTHNIYLYRWGDAVLRYYSTKLFLEKNKVVQLCNFSYRHKKFYSSFC